MYRYTHEIKFNIITANCDKSSRDKFTSLGIAMRF